MIKWLFCVNINSPMFGSENFKWNENIVIDVIIKERMNSYWVFHPLCNLFPTRTNWRTVFSLAFQAYRDKFFRSRASESISIIQDGFCFVYYLLSIDVHTYCFRHRRLKESTCLQHAGNEHFWCLTALPGLNAILGAGQLQVIVSIALFAPCHLHYQWIVVGFSYRREQPCVNRHPQVPISSDSLQYTYILACPYRLVGWCGCATCFRSVHRWQNQPWILLRSASRVLIHRNILRGTVFNHTESYSLWEVLCHSLPFQVHQLHDKISTDNHCGCSLGSVVFIQCYLQSFEGEKWWVFLSHCLSSYWLQFDFEYRFVL